MSSYRPSSTDLKVVEVIHAGVRRNVLLYAGASEDDIRSAITTAFESFGRAAIPDDAEIIGLQCEPLGKSTEPRLVSLASLCKNPQQITDVVRLVFRSRAVGQPSGHSSGVPSSTRYNPYGKPSAAATSLSSSQPGSPLGPVASTGNRAGVRQMARLRDDEERSDAARRRAQQAEQAATAAALASQQAASFASLVPRRTTSASEDVVVSVEFMGQVRRLGIPNGLYPSELARVLEAVLPASHGRMILGFRQNGRQPLSLHAVAREPRALLMGAPGSAVPPQWQLVVDTAPSAAIDERPVTAGRRERKRWAAPQSPVNSAPSFAPSIASAIPRRMAAAPVSAWPEPSSAPRSPVVSSLGSPSVLSEDDDDVRSMSTTTSNGDYRRRLDDSVIDEENPDEAYSEDQDSRTAADNDIEEYDDSQLSVDDEASGVDGYSNRDDDDEGDDQQDDDDVEGSETDNASTYSDLQIRGHGLVPQPAPVTRSSPKFKLTSDELQVLRTVLSRTDLRSRRALEIFPEFTLLVGALVRALDIDTLPESKAPAAPAAVSSSVPSSSSGSYSSFVPRAVTSNASNSTARTATAAPAPRSSVPVPVKQTAAPKPQQTATTYARESKAPVVAQRYDDDEDSEEDTDDSETIASYARQPSQLQQKQGGKPSEAAENAFARTLSWMEANELITTAQRNHLDQLAVDEDASVLAALVAHQVNGDQADLVHSLQLIAAMETVRARNLARGDRTTESSTAPLSVAATASRQALAGPMSRGVPAPSASATASPLRPSAAQQAAAAAKQSSASLPRQPPMSSPQRAPAKAAESKSPAGLTPLMVAGYNAADEAKAMHETILQLVRAGKLGGSDGVALTKLVVGRLLQAARELQPPSPVGGSRAQPADDDDFDHVPEASSTEKDNHNRLATIFEQYGRSTSPAKDEGLVAALRALVVRIDGGVAPAKVAPAKAPPAKTAAPAKAPAKQPAPAQPFAIESDEDEDTPSEEDDEEEAKRAGAAAAALGGDDAAAFAAATEDLKTLERELLEKMVQLLKLEESITDEQGDELLRLGRARDELLMAAFNVYQEDQNWPPFRDTAVRLAQSSIDRRRGSAAAAPAKTAVNASPAKVAPAKSAPSSASTVASKKPAVAAAAAASAAVSDAVAAGESDEMDVLATLEPEVRQALLVVSVMASNGALSQSQARALWALILTKDEQLTKAFADARRSDDWGKLYETLLNTLRLRQGGATTNGNGAASSSSSSRGAPIDEEDDEDDFEGDDDEDFEGDTSSQQSDDSRDADAPVTSRRAPTYTSTASGAGGADDENTAEEAALVRAVADLRKSDEITPDESSQILRLYATRDASIVGALESYMVDQNRVELRDTIRVIARESTAQQRRQ